VCIYPHIGTLPEPMKLNIRLTNKPHDSHHFELFLKCVIPVTPPFPLQIQIPGYNGRIRVTRRPDTSHHIKSPRRFSSDLNGTMRLMISKRLVLQIPPTHPHTTTLHVRQSCPGAILFAAAPTLDCRLQYVHRMLIAYSFTFSGTRHAAGAWAWACDTSHKSNLNVSRNSTKLRRSVCINFSLHSVSFLL
jgi:hypothetical protein